MIWLGKDCSKELAMFRISGGGGGVGGGSRVFVRVTVNCMLNTSAKEDNVTLKTMLYYNF